MMAREIAVMPTRPALFRHLAGTLLCVLLALPAVAQDLPAQKITGEDLRRALIWTGHFSVMTTGDPNTLFRAALQSWQAAKKYKVTDNLSDEQEMELLAEGDKQRDSVGWAKFEDKSIGFSVGVPTKLVKFLGARTNDGGLAYDFEGTVVYGISVRYGDLSCSNVDQQLALFSRAARPTFRARLGDGYALGVENDSLKAYLRVVCRTSGVVFASVDIGKSNADKLGMLISAMSESLSVSRNF